MERKISSIFLSLLPLYMDGFDRNKFDWDIGKIDMKLQAERYSPLYNKDVGIKGNKFLYGK